MLRENAKKLIIIDLIVCFGKLRDVMHFQNWPRFGVGMVYGVGRALRLQSL